MPDRMVIAYEDATGVLKPLSVGNADGAALPVWLASLLAGENQLLSLIETSLPGTYVPVSPVTSNVDFALGSPGAAGNKLYGLAIYNGSGAAFSAFTIKDGATAIDFVAPGALTTLANGAYHVWTPPIAGVPIESRNGGWQMRITCAGTMANIKIAAFVAE